jgi:hypothetical protein
MNVIMISLVYSLILRLFDHYPMDYYLVINPDFAVVTKNVSLLQLCDFSCLMFLHVLGLPADSTTK